MSGEFRELYGHSPFAWAMLAAAADDSEAGGHPISQALQPVYRALAKVERGCAWHEACDSGPHAPVMALLESWDQLEAAFKELGKLRVHYQSIVSEAVRLHEASKEQK